MNQPSSDHLQATPEQLTFEQAQQQLEAIVHDLEEGQIGLAESLVRYEQGVKLLKACHAMLGEIEQKIELLTGVGADGQAVTEPFDDEASAALDEKGQRRNRRRSTAYGS